MEAKHLGAQIRNMKHFIPGVLLLLYSTCVFAQSADIVTFSNGGPTVLRGSSASEVLKQCSHAAPESAESYWTPSQSEVSNLEAALSKHLVARQATGLRVPPVQEYARQYAGFKMGGKSYIYGNFYPHENASSQPKSRAVVVCDGGPSFWGIVFAVGSQTFEEPQFNGAL